MTILAQAREKERRDFFCVSLRKKERKIKLIFFVRMLQSHKYEHSGDEIKRMDLIADFLKRLCLDYADFEIDVFFSFMYMSFLNCTPGEIVFSLSNCVPVLAMSLGVLCEPEGLLEEECDKSRRQCEAPGNHCRLQAEGLIRQLTIHQDR